MRGRTAYPSRVLLLVHGEEDNNSGTYPLQSVRYFNALKGLGATTRLVMFPKESHGYRAKESILHLIWEQDRWLDMHVKNNWGAPWLGQCLEYQKRKKSLRHGICLFAVAQCLHFFEIPNFKFDPVMNSFF